MFRAISVCFSRYFTFSGRARRPEYWWFVLFVVVVSGILALIDSALFGPPGDEKGDQTGPLQGLFQLVTFIPMLAAGWRRMHDTGRTGWLLLLPVMVSVALVFVLIFGVALFGVTHEVAGGAASPEEAGALGISLGMAALGGIALIVVYVLMIWWLTRPTEPQDNRFGPVPPEWGRG